MGKLIDFITNVGNEKSDKSKGSNQTSPYIKIKIFNKRLARQIRKMEIEEKRAREKAIKAKKDGQIEKAKIYMKSSLQYRKWNNATESFRMKMEHIQYKLEQAKAMESFSSVVKEIAGVMNTLKSQVNVPQISKIVADFGMDFKELDGAMSEISGKLEDSEDVSATAVSESEVKEELEKLDAIDVAESGIELPSAPSGEVQVEEMEIDDLEKEIKQLKATRGN